MKPMMIIVQPIANTQIIMINDLPSSAKETLLNQLTRRVRELKWYEYLELQDIKIIAEIYGFEELIKEIIEIEN